MDRTEPAGLTQNLSGSLLVSQPWVLVHDDPLAELYWSSGGLWPCGPEVSSWRPVCQEEQRVLTLRGASQRFNTFSKEHQSGGQRSGVLKQLNTTNNFSFYGFFSRTSQTCGPPGKTLLSMCRRQHVIGWNQPRVTVVPPLLLDLKLCES